MEPSSLRDTFYPNLPDARLRALCKAREYAHDIVRQYKAQSRPDVSTHTGLHYISKMSEILMDLSDSLLWSKPFRSHSLSEAISRGFTATTSKDNSWLLRFAHSFLLVMAEIEQRDIAILENIPAESTATSPLNFDDSFYSKLSELNLRRLCKARECANDVRLHYLTHPRPNDAWLRTMSEILMDLVDALMSNKPLVSDPLSEAFTKESTAAPNKHNVWLDRFAHSFLLVMKELQQRRLVIFEDISADPVIAAIQPGPSTSLKESTSSLLSRYSEHIGHKYEEPPEEQIQATHFDNFSLEIKEEPIEKKPRPNSPSMLVRNEPIEQIPLHEYFPLNVKEESLEGEEDIEEASNIASTSRATSGEADVVDSSISAFVGRLLGKESNSSMRIRSPEEELVIKYKIPATVQELREMSIDDLNSMWLTVKQWKVIEQIRKIAPMVTEIRSRSRSPIEVYNVPSSSSANSSEVGTSCSDACHPPSKKLPTASLPRNFAARVVETHDEALVIHYKIPATVKALCEMDIGEFLALRLTEEQLSIARDIRKRAKKRIAKKRCLSNKFVLPRPHEPGASQEKKRGLSRY